MHAGELTPDELRGWILNRFHYQRHIPSRTRSSSPSSDDPELRRSWLRRIQDHDGPRRGEGGIERWLRLGEAAGMERDVAAVGRGRAPGCTARGRRIRQLVPLRSAARSRRRLAHRSCRTGPHAHRIDAFERHYRWIDPEGLRYFRARVSQGGQDSGEALALVLEWARTRPSRRRPSRPSASSATCSGRCSTPWTPGHDRTTPATLARALAVGHVPPRPVRAAPICSYCPSGRRAPGQAGVHRRLCDGERTSPTIVAELAERRPERGWPKKSRSFSSGCARRAG